MNFVIKLEQQMGLNLKWLEVGPSEDEFTFFILYEKKLMMSQNPEANVSHPNIILSTNNIESTYTDMKLNDVMVEELMIMPYGKMFKFKDQDNNEYLVREDR